ncbi:MAG: YHS domain-containing protein [Betaproteobacteria bacterium]|nr:YHS domain-containing protein [Betaproteobacteria bacterium]
MDAETLKSLWTLLLWGGLFFLMMRYGCGAHMMGGHGKHGRHRHGAPPADGGAQRDPVCGMAIDPLQAAAASVHAGATYYFCSAACRDRFERAPREYLTAPAS